LFCRKKIVVLNSVFTKNILRMAGTSVVAVLISFLSIPLISRLYSPEDFGNFQVLLSTIGIFSVISSFKYEMAIVIPKRNKEADAVYSLALVILMTTTIIFSTLLYVFGKVLLSLLNAQVLEPYVFLMVLAIFFSGLIQVLRYSLIRDGKFYKLGNNTVLEVAASQGLKIGLGVISPSFISMFISQVSGYVLAIILAKKYSTVRMAFSRKRLAFALFKYKKFFIFSTPSVFINNLSLQLPVFLIAKYYGPEYVGYYILAVKLIEAPLSIVSNSISEVYYKEAVDTYNNLPEYLPELYFNIVTKLSLFVLIPSVIIFLLAGTIVPVFLGMEWTNVALLMEIIIIWKFFEFVNTPVSTTLTIINEQHIDFLLKLIFSLGLRIAAALLFHGTFDELLSALVISASVYYIIFNFVTYWRVKRIS